MPRLFAGDGWEAVMSYGEDGEVHRQSAEPSISVIFADDHFVVRQGVRALLEEDAGCRIVGEASTGREVVEKAVALEPDVAIVDIRMPGLNGLEATRQIRSRGLKTQVVVLTLHDTEDLVRDLLRSGAMGYVLKSDTARDLVRAVRSVAEGRPFFTSCVAKMVLQGYLEPHQSACADERLTAREREVVQLLAEGRSNKEVACALNISVKTAETHRAHVMRTLNLNSVCELVHYAVRQNIIEA
jgi:DNA-binding NarL/FixJ family response regulator